MKQNKTDDIPEEKVGDEKVDEEETKIVELNEKYLRALADYQNLSRQTETWKADFVQYANVPLIMNLLEVLDDLEKAQENLKDNGLALIISKFKKLLESEGLEVVELEGKEYDPTLAEVISMEPALTHSDAGGDKDNVVTKVLQKGYKLRDRIIRPAKVIVSTIKTNES